MRHLLSLSLLSFALIALSACSSTDEDTGCTASSCGEGTVCDAATGQCVLDDSNDCLDDSECTDGLVCRNSECVSRCDGVQCSTGQTCDPTTGLCEDDGTGGGGGEGDCSSDEDCAAQGVSCIDGACLAGAFADCSQFECQDGLNCATGIIGSQCLVPCSEASDCGIIEQCLTDPPVFLAGFRDHCFANTCGPFDQFPPGDIRTNILQDAQYLGPCPVSGDADGGICWGEFDLNPALGRGGICMGAPAPRCMESPVTQQPPTATRTPASIHSARRRQIPAWISVISSMMRRAPKVPLVWLSPTHQAMTAPAYALHRSIRLSPPLKPVPRAHFSILAPTARSVRRAICKKAPRLSAFQLVSSHRMTTAPAPVRPALAPQFLQISFQNV